MGGQLDVGYLDGRTHTLGKAQVARRRRRPDGICARLRIAR